MNTTIRDIYLAWKIIYICKIMDFFICICFALIFWYVCTKSERYILYKTNLLSSFITPVDIGETPNNQNKKSLLDEVDIME